MSFSRLRKWSPFVMTTSGCVLLAISGWTTVVQAQVTFSWPDTPPPDIATYKTVEHCLGAIKKIRRFVARIQPRTDTLPRRLLDTINVEPPAVAAAAQRCGVKFSVEQLVSRDTLYISEMENAHKLLLMASRDRDAQALADRWFASIPPKDDTLHGAVLGHLVANMLNARPTRLAMAWPLVEAIDSKFWKNRMSLISSIMQEAVRIHDTNQAVRAAKWLAAQPALLGDSITQSEAWQDIYKGCYGCLVNSALLILHKQALLDSLRTGTKAYTTYLETLRTQSALHWTVKKRESKPIEGDYWFPSTPPTPRPARGTISIVLTTGENDCGRCLDRITMIQRLHQSYPNVEFTLLTRTRGYHGLVIEPPPPSVEAQLIDSVWRKVNRLPAMVVVYQTPFWRLPDPDRRRINEGGPNEETYPTLYRRGSDKIYLVDRDGEIIYVSGWDSRSEEFLGELIDALLHQLHSKTL